MKTLLLLLVSTTLLMACQNNTSSTKVQDLDKQFINAWNNKDTTHIDSFLASDVQFIQADKHFNGKADVVNNWVAATVGSVSNLRTNTISSNIDDHSAYEGGMFSVDVTTPGQPSAIGEGNFLFQWKKQADGSWKISYIQLEDLPLQVARK